MTRTYRRQFNLHKTIPANEELVISLINGREVQERKTTYRLLHHYNSLSNKMDNSLLAVRDINHKYIVVEKNFDTTKNHYRQSSYTYLILIRKRHFS